MKEKEKGVGNRGMQANRMELLIVERPRTT
jgi:hypothetical protein